MDLSTGVFNPSIVAYTPSQETTGVGTLPVIDITFSIAVNQTQFTDVSSLGSLILVSELATNTSIDVSYVSYNSQSHTLTVTPTRALIPGYTYQVNVSENVVSTSGRKMLRNVTWTFLIDSYSIEQVELISPVTITTCTTFPTFTWSAATSATNYVIEIATSPRFTPDVLVYTGNITTTSITPAALTIGTQYFWRVKGSDNTGTTIGPWSLTNTFYYGNEIDSSLDSRIEQPHAGEFGILTLFPEDASSNETSFPLIYAIFSDTVEATSVTSDTFKVSYAAVDGDSTVTPGILAGTYSVVGSRIVFTPTAAIQSNMRYTITIAGIVSTSGDVLAEVSSSYFTSTYTPLYTSSLELRGKFGSFLTSFSDDFINYQIFKASIYCNSLIGAAPEGDSATLTNLKINAISITYAIQQYVLHATAYALLQVRQFELIEEIDQKKQLADFSVSVGPGSLVELTKLLKELKNDLTKEEVILMGDKATPTVGVRSSEWEISQISDDTSVATLRKVTF